MNTLKILSFVFLTSFATLAHAADYPTTPADVTNSLGAQVLSAAQVADLADASKPTAKPYSDITDFTKAQQAPVANAGDGGQPEGIPDGTDVAPNVMDGAYTASELITQALEDRQTMAIGQRISFLQEQAGRIISVSGARPTELLLRVTLNRSVDVVDHILPIVGRNTDYVARELANFYKENFELAASFGNNNICLSSRVNGSTTADALRDMSVAEYGRIYATLLWRYSQDLSSDSAKAVILMRMIGYLGWDFNADLRRREHTVAQTIVDIYMLQHSQIYTKILQTLQSGHEPDQGDLAEFRSRIYQILQRLPERLHDAGIQTSGS